MPASQRTLERRIRAVYTEAQKDLQKKLDDYIVKFRAKDAQMRQDLAEQAITQKEYDEWRQGAIFQGKAWRARLKQVTDTLANANEESLRLVRGEQLNEFAEGMNHEQFVLAQNTGLSINFGIYDAETVGKLIREQPDLLPPKKLNRGKDERWNQKKVTGSILQGIIQGESIDDIAKRIARDTARQNSKAMIRYARTATTGAQNAGRMETMHRAHGMGINVRKQWLATLDARTRDSHRHLDGEVVDIDEPFRSDFGKIMFPGDPSAHPGDVYNCFVGETNIATDSEIIRSYKHDYSGKLITVKTSSGVEFTCTPNHPILTPSGWVAAERLQDRNNLLIASIGEDDPLRINPYIEHAFTRIDAIHQLFDEMGSKRTARLGVNFHGDVPTTDVEIITQKRFLRNNRDSGCADGVNKLLLKHSDESLMGKGAFVQHFGSVWFAALRFMCGFGKALSLFGRRVIHAVVHGFRPIAGSDATVLQAQSDDVTGDVQFLRESLDGFSGKVFVDNIVNIKITTVSHVPVYNLQTGNSRYFVNSIIAQNGEKCNGKFAIAHNCRCTMVYVYPGYPTDPGERLDNVTGEHVRGDMTYAEWAGTQPAAQPEKKPEEKRKKPGEKLAGVEQGEPMTHEQADAYGAVGGKAWGAYKGEIPEDIRAKIDAALTAGKGTRTLNEYWRDLVDGKEQNAEIEALMRQIGQGPQPKDGGVNLSEDTIKAIDGYIEGTGNKFTDKQIKEIKAAMEKTDKPLYRVEDAQWMADGLKVGDEFTFDKPLKGFTQDMDGIRTVVAEGDDAGLYEETLAIFKTEGGTEAMDISGISRNHAEEKESLVGGKFEVVSVEDGPEINGHKTRIIKIRQIDAEKDARI